MRFAGYFLAFVVCGIGMALFTAEPKPKPVVIQPPPPPEPKKEKPIVSEKND